VTTDRPKAAEALEVIAESKRQGSTDQAESDYRELMELAEFFKPVKIESARVNTPPGLLNIGNTCYLNSLLQYFYNVKPVRDLVLGYPQNCLKLDEESVNSRRIGGSGEKVALEEAIVGKLCELFCDNTYCSLINVKRSHGIATEAVHWSSNNYCESDCTVSGTCQYSTEACRETPGEEDNLGCQTSAASREVISCKANRQCGAGFRFCQRHQLTDSER
jgi:hypothetical protein